MKKEAIIKIIEKRIKELQEARNENRAGNSRTKYNFVIGELMNLKIDIEKLT